MAQTREWTDGFDMYPANLSQNGYGLHSTWDALGNPVRLRSGRFGGYAVESDALSGASALTRYVTEASQAVIGSAVYVQGDTSATIHSYRRSSGPQLEFVRREGKLAIMRGSTVLAASNDVLPAGGWLYLETACSISSTVGATKVAINGREVPELALSGVNTQGQAAGGITMTGLHFGNSNSGYYQDDAYCEIGGMEFVGEGRMTVQRVSSVVSSQFTPSTGANNAATIDDARPDASDYNYSSTVGHRDVFNLQGMGWTPTRIFGAQLVSIAQKNETAVRVLTPFIISGTEEQAGDGHVLANNSFRAHRSWMPIDPNTGLPWTQAAQDALKIGYEITE